MLNACHLNGSIANTLLTLPPHLLPLPRLADVQPSTRGSLCGSPRGRNPGRSAVGGEPPSPLGAGAASTGSLAAEQPWEERHWPGAADDSLAQPSCLEFATLEQGLRWVLGAGGAAPLVHLLLTLAASRHPAALAMQHRLPSHARLPPHARLKQHQIGPPTLDTGTACRYCEDQLLELAVRYGLCQPPSARMPLEDMLASHLAKVRQSWPANKVLAVPLWCGAVQLPLHAVLISQSTKSCWAWSATPVYNTLYSDAALRLALPAGARQRRHGGRCSGKRAAALCRGRAPCCRPAAVARGRPRKRLFCH